MKRISLEEVELVSFKLARERFSFNESIPDFSTRYPDRLESCIAMPFMKFDGKPLYSTLVARASILFYLMNKSHPFENGNKRIAVLTLLMFLHKHNKWLTADTESLYKFAIGVAGSRPMDKDLVVTSIEWYIAKHITPLEE